MGDCWEGKVPNFIRNANFEAGSSKSLNKKSYGGYLSGDRLGGKKSHWVGLLKILQNEELARGLYTSGKEEG